MGDQVLMVPQGYELLLVSNARDFLKLLIDLPEVRATLKTPNEMTLIFRADGDQVAGLKQLHGEVVSLLTDIEKGLARSFKKLETARISY
jgi:hypothetical protein